MFLCHPTLFGSMRSLSDVVSGRNVLLRGFRRCGMNALLALGFRGSGFRGSGFRV